MSSNLDMSLGDIIQSKKKNARSTGKRVAGGRSTGIAKGRGRQQQQQQGPQRRSNNNNNNNNNSGNTRQTNQRRPRAQVKQAPVNAMRGTGRQQRQTVTASRVSTGRNARLQKARGLGPIVQPQLSVPATQPVLVYQGANGQQIVQPVAVIPSQVPGAPAQVVPTAPATKTGPIFKAANRQKNAGGNRRQSGGNTNRRQSGGRRN